MTIALNARRTRRSWLASFGSLPTQLDITTAIALAGLAIAIVSLWLTLRRDRAAGRVGVRIVIEAGQSRHQDNAPELRVTFSNPERRTVTVQRAGLSVRRDARGRREFKGWDPVPAPTYGGQFAGMLSPFAGGILLGPGDPAHTVRARMYRVRGACFPDVAHWAWCDDSIGGIHWERVPSDVQAAIAVVKRHKLGTAESGGGRPSIEVEDSEVVDQSDLDIDPFGQL